MDRSARNYPLEDIDRETMFHPNTSIVDHLKKGPHIMAQASGVRVRDRQGRELIDKERVLRVDDLHVRRLTEPS